MTQEDKEVLLKDLSSRLPYNVKVNFQDMENPYGLETPAVLTPSILREFWCKAEDIRPYLRPMSSMTDEEKKELLNLLFDKEAEHFYIDKEGLIDGKPSNLFKDGLNYPSFYPVNIVLYTNWLLEHHFDFMGLIPNGLAIEVTEENNPYKE